MNKDELREAIKDVYAPAGEPRFTWARREYEVKRRILNDDPALFLQWPTIAESMFVANAPYIKIEYAALKKSNDWQRWKAAISGVHFGGGERFAGSTGNQIHQAYSLMQWEYHARRHVEDLETIYEFGGGYGSMALLCRRLGFTGEYIIQDLPVFGLLQEYYLTNVGINDVIYTTTNAPGYSDLLISLWAISETGLDTRRALFDSRSAANYLMSYVPNWDKFDNTGYFKLFKRNNNCNWHDYVIEHLPNNRYLIGVW